MESIARLGLFFGTYLTILNYFIKKIFLILNMRKDFMVKAVKLTKVCFNAISAAEFLINKVEEEQREINEGLKTFEISLASKQIWILRQAMNLIVNSQQTLDLIENGYMCPLDDIDL